MIKGPQNEVEKKGEQGGSTCTDAASLTYLIHQTGDFFIRPQGWGNCSCTLFTAQN